MQYNWTAYEELNTKSNSEQTNVRAAAQMSPEDYVQVRDAMRLQQPAGSTPSNPTPPPPKKPKKDPQPAADIPLHPIVEAYNEQIAQRNKIRKQVFCSSNIIPHAMGTSMTTTIAIIIIIVFISLVISSRHRYDHRHLHSLEGDCAPPEIENRFRDHLDY